ncbi:MAG: AI-2E family transporter [Gammaproteobacteria bacterium]|nr:MAG: AI-2E family transporter [Gammaproteobacteria bacterium]
MNNPRLIVGLGFVVGTGVLIYLLAPVLMPFLVGALLAYLGQPLVTRLTRRRLPRVVAVLAVFALFIAAVTALLLFLIPTIQHQIASFTQRLPRYLDWLQHEALPWVESVTGAGLALDMETLRQALVAHWQEMGGWLKASVAYVMQSGLRIVGWLVSLVLIPVVTFYLLLDWDRLLARIAALFPAAYRPRLRQLALETDAVLGGFLRGQFSVMLALAAFYSAGLWLIGLDLALPIGIAAGLLSFVPYLGFLTGLVAAGIGAWVQFQDAHMLLWVAALFGFGQALEGLVLTPRLVGERTGLHPVAVIFAVMAGGQLFGFTGVLLALPVAAVLKVWLRHLHEYYVPPAPTRRRARRPAP